MSTEENVTLRDDFYRDSFGKVIFIGLSLIVALVVMVGLALYLYLSKPKPVTFLTYANWRIQPDVPLDQPYLTVPALFQWLTDALPQAFNYDFIHYPDQLKQAQGYFTDNGWKVFVNHLNVYANPAAINTNKLFITGTLIGAPFLLQSGLYGRKAAWWVQIPMSISYAGSIPMANKTLTLQVLVVRVSTLTNLNGVGIDNVIVAKSSDNG